LVKYLLVKPECEALFDCPVALLPFQLLENNFILAYELACTEMPVRFLVNDVSSQDEEYVLALVTFFKDVFGRIESHWVQLIQIV
jgi:hypothetical protein